MALYLYEVVPADPGRDATELLIKEVDTQIGAAGGDLIEAQVTAGYRRVFVIAEYDGTAPPLDPATAGADQVAGPDPVRLVGPALDALKAARPTAGYLVEWDLPAELDMDTYLARKAAKAPQYAEVPEVSFLRTYVREDMAKCLCFYDAPDHDAVLRARGAVQTPVDRLHGLEDLP
ncbi:DUF4242 domain-containing protein [Mycobacterium eburneum]|nr:DUF4242 domain-containing protein [Mycobacterium eburneum]TDH56089.1 DUF4242 domain-containing protein [Mycobacterium eburneum]